jgi:type IV pilus assembly protein PilY1
MISNRIYLKRFSLLFVSLILIGMLATVVMATVSQTPLYLTTGVKANVAILLDNSGSMWNIMYHPHFPTDDTTASWHNKKFNDANDYQLLYDKRSGNYYLEELNTSNDFYGDNKRNFAYNGKTLKLPVSSDPKDEETRYNGAYLNWLFYDGASADDINAITSSTDKTYQKTRIRAAKDAIKALISNSYNSSTASYPYRWGVFTYTYDYSDSAPPSLGDCSDDPADITALLQEVEDLQPSMNTPLGNSLLALWNYFKDSENGPITESCQKNFVIAVTDGYPYIPDYYPGKNYDPYKQYNYYTNNGGSDAHSASTSSSDYWYNPDFPNDKYYRSKAHIVTLNMHTTPARTGMPGSTIDTYVIGLAFGQADADDSSLLLNKMATNGGGESFGASDSNLLITSLNSVVNSIASRLSSASSVAVNSAYLSMDTTLYWTKFNSGIWTGSLEAYQLDPSTGNVVTPSSWEAGSLLNSRTTARNIYTAGSVSSTYKRMDFNTSSLTLLESAGFPTADATNLISYIRGDTTPAGYRTRTSKLGDMIYSAPVYIGPPAGTYTDNNYQSFKTSNSSRTPLVIVGANDGMLHAFNATNGNEEWAFIPSSLWNKLSLLGQDPYTHQNYVDGTPTIADAYIASKDTSGTSTSADWHTILVCGLREGGRSYFAMDVTDPANPIPLWEITPSSPTSNGLGYSFGSPLILKLKYGTGFKWVAVLPNGYEGTTSGKSASLIIADLETGAILKEIVVDSTTFSTGVSANGLSSPSAIDTDGDGYANFIYAGDLKGNLWKFDVSGNSESSWHSFYMNITGTTPVPLFEAKNGQPITTAPDIVVRGGFQIVFFGTGKYYEDADKTDLTRQSFYGIYDYNIMGSNLPYTIDNLVEQEITEFTGSDGNEYRTITSNTVTPGSDASSDKGWYVDLPGAGERVFTDSVAHGGKIIFTTFIPNAEPCSFGGTSWLMELNQENGGAVSYAVFDVNGDGIIDDNDKINGSFPVGVNLGDGGASSPAIVGDDTKDNNEYKYITKTTGEIMKVMETSLGSSKLGMRSWRQIR